MNAQLVESLVSLIQALPPAERQLLEERLLTKPQRQSFFLDPKQLEALGGEFAQADRELAEAGINDYATRLRLEDLRS